MNNPFINETLARPEIEVQPCRLVGFASVETCAEKEAEFFGVYCRDEKGIATWLADFSTKGAADRFATSMRERQP